MVKLNHQSPTHLFTDVHDLKSYINDLLYFIRVADEYPAETSPPANNDDSSGDILRPMKDPSAGLNDGLKKMGGEDW